MNTLICYRLAIRQYIRIERHYRIATKLIYYITTIKYYYVPSPDGGRRGQLSGADGREGSVDRGGVLEPA